MYAHSPPLYRGMKASYAWTQSGSYVTPILLPGVHPYHCFRSLSLLVSVCIGQPFTRRYPNSLHIHPHPWARANATGVNISSWRRLTDGHRGKSSSLWPEILEGKTDKRRGGGKDGRLQRAIEGVNEREEEEEEMEVNRVK